jgi:DNA polymerase-3 subunit epsilon
MPRLLAWRRGRAAAGAQDVRWVVLDLETGGLDPSSDAILSIGAVAVRGLRVVVADSLELAVRPERTSPRPNILVHGIGADAQRAGVDPGQACERLLEFVGDSPIAAFHAGFDRRFLERALRRQGAARLRNRWLDVAQLAHALEPASRAHTLDDWLARYGLAVERRHDAASDAFATAMLFVCLLARTAPAERDPRSLAHRIDSQRWLGGEAGRGIGA